MSRYASTVKHLKLEARFKRRANSVVAEVRDEIASLTLNDKEAARALVRQHAGRKARLFGMNFWHAVLLDALADSDACLELSLSTL